MKNYQMYGPVQKTSVFMLFYMVCAVSLFGISQGLCPRDPSNRARFGPNCELVCHCKDDAECNSDGHCPEGIPCDPRFYGPMCQLVAVPFDAYVTYQNALGLRDVPELIDKKVDTCSSGLNAFGGTAYLTLKFTRPIFIVGLLVLGVKDNSTTFSTYFRNILGTQILCAKSSYLDYQSIIVCDTYGSAVIIEFILANPVSQFSICEILLFAGLSYGYGKVATQSTVDKTSKASNAVDGLLVSTPSACSVTDMALTRDPWWAVDMGAVYLCNTVLVYAAGDDGSICKFTDFKFKENI